MTPPLSRTAFPLAPKSVLLISVDALKPARVPPYGSAPNPPNSRVKVTGLVTPRMVMSPSSRKVPPSGRSPVEVNVIFGYVAISKKLLPRRSSSRIWLPVSMVAILTSPSACESSTFSAVTMFPVNSVNLPRIFDTIRCWTMNATSECTGSIVQVPTTYPGIFVLAAVIRTLLRLRLIEDSVFHRLDRSPTALHLMAAPNEPNGPEPLGCCFVFDHCSGTAAEGRRRRLHTRTAAIRRRFATSSVRNEPACRSRMRRPLPVQPVRPDQGVAAHRFREVGRMSRTATSPSEMARANGADRESERRRRQEFDRRSSGRHAG